MTAARATLLFLALASPGCFSVTLVRNIERARPRRSYGWHETPFWNGGDVPRGRYVGKISSGAVAYHEYAFEAKLRPRTDRSVPIAILVPIAGAEEPIIEVGRTRPGGVDDSFLYVHSAAEVDHDEITGAVVRRWPGVSKEDVLRPRDHPTIVLLRVTKRGAASELVVGQPDGAAVAWSQPHVFSPRPAEPAGSKWSAMRRLAYAGLLLTVPLDLATSPIQAPVFTTVYLMNRGMSPR